MKSLKKALAELESGKAEYQESLRGIFAIADFQREAAAYQAELAAAEAARFEQEKNRRDESKGDLRPQKMRIRFKAAIGRSPNNFLMGAATGQIDAALIAYKAANGKYPDEQACKAIISLLNIWAEKAMVPGRAYEHLKYWQEKGFKGRKLYLD